MTNMHKETVITTDAPGAIGPYSQAVKLGNVLYTSGQLGIDPVNGTFPATVEEQTERSLLNVTGSGGYKHGPGNKDDRFPKGYE